MTALSKRPFLLIVSLFAISLFHSACGYHLVGTSSFLPEEYQNLFIERMKNNTSWPDLGQRMDEALSREWVRRRRFQLVESRDQAQIVLEGSIQSISMLPVQLDERGRATQYQMTLLVSARLIDPRGEEPKVLWEDKAFSRRTSYNVDASSANYFDRQIQAMEEVSAELSRALVTAVLEGF